MDVRDFSGMGEQMMQVGTFSSYVLTNIYHMAAFLLGVRLKSRRLVPGPASVGL